MNKEYIESGILELYVFGVTTEEENKEVQDMARQHEDVQAEILSIEKAVIDLSYAVSPDLSPEVYHRVRMQLIEKHSGVVPMESRKSNTASYLGWAAAVIFLFGIGAQYYMYNQETQEAQSASAAQRNKYEQMVASLTKDNTQSEKALNVIRAKNSSVVTLAGQEAAPDAYAKMYVNNDKKEIYVDIAGLPEAPEGKVYQVWAIMLDPLTPTSIGVLDKDKVADSKGIIAVDNFNGAQAFGITLEPAGGSPSPTMEMLYTLGKV